MACPLFAGFPKSVSGKPAVHSAIYTRLRRKRKRGTVAFDGFPAEFGRYARLRQKAERLAVVPQHFTNVFQGDTDALVHSKLLLHENIDLRSSMAKARSRFRNLRRSFRAAAFLREDYVFWNDAAICEQVKTGIGENRRDAYARRCDR